MDDKPKSKITASNLFVEIRSKLLNLLLKNTNLDLKSSFYLLANPITCLSLSSATTLV